MKYDIFISYRREDGKEFARQIQLKLQNFGYNVFLDVEELRDGIFDQRIIDAICESTVFIALLTPKYLIRCSDTADWVRKEIECAIENNLNIVPININCQFNDFPKDCPESVRSNIGSHQYSEIFTGQQFTNTMKDMDEHRIRPYINKNTTSAHLGTIGATIRIKPDIDCYVVKFGERIATLQANTYNVLRLMKGKHLLDFISIECSDDHYEKIYQVEDNNSEDFFEIELLPIKKNRLDLIEQEKRRIKEEKERTLRETKEKELRLKREAEAEQRRIEEARRKAQEEKEREEILRKERIEKERKEQERNNQISEEITRLKRLVQEGKGRDGVYIIGDYFNRNGIQGVVVEVDEYDNYIKIVSLTEYRTQWASNENFGNIFKKDIPSNTLLSANYRVRSEGYKNRNIVESITNWQDKYPAFYVSKNGWKDIINDKLSMWHLPSVEDLEYIAYNLESINKTIKRLSYPIIKEGNKYWSSTEKNANEAYTCKLDGDLFPVDNSLSKSDFAYVRSIIILPLYDESKNLINQEYKEKALEARWRDLGLIPYSDGVSTHCNQTTGFNGDWGHTKEDDDFTTADTITHSLMKSLILNIAKK